MERQLHGDCCSPYDGGPHPSPLRSEQKYEAESILRNYLTAETDDNKHARRLLVVEPVK